MNKGKNFKCPTLWRIEYDNDTGPRDEGFWEWWEVTNDEKCFKCTNQKDAKWLRDLLNNIEGQIAV